MVERIRDSKGRFVKQNKENMKIKIRVIRGIKKGKEFVHIIKDGELYTSLSLASNSITSDVCLENYISPGIFAPTEAEMRYGNFSKNFVWGKKISMLQTPPEEIQKEIQKRVDEVKKWKKSLNYTEEFTIVLQ